MSNYDLAPLPPDEEFVRAVETIVAENRESRSVYRQFRGATAQDVAYFLRIERARRAGRGAVKGSWSGSMAPALRAAPRLRSLARRGLVRKRRDPLDPRGRDEYLPV